MDKIKILVACHKPGKVYQNKVYVPVHAGRTLHKDIKELEWMIGDDTGENISKKNSKYSEMTVQYWAWKNLKDVEYIGFCHYRRYFDFTIDNDKIDSIFKGYDVILLGYKSMEMIERNVIRSVSSEDVSIFLMVLKRMYPDYEKDVINYLWDNEKHTNNMLICRKELFDEYARWIFNILKECEKFIRESPYSRGKRVYAYLAEYFMPVFFLHNHYRIKNVRYISYPGEKQSKMTLYVKDLLKDCLFSLSRPFYKKPSCFEDYYNQAVLVGLANDGINP